MSFVPPLSFRLPSLSLSVSFLSIIYTNDLYRKHWSRKYLSYSIFPALLEIDVDQTNTKQHEKSNFRWWKRRKRTTLFSEIWFIAFDVGERNPNLGLRAVNMGSLCFYMREESRLGGGVYQVCAIWNNYTMRAYYFFCSKTGQTRFLLDKRDTCWLDHNLDPRRKRSWCSGCDFCSVI